MPPKKAKRAKRRPLRGGNFFSDVFRGAKSVISPAAQILAPIVMPFAQAAANAAIQRKFGPPPMAGKGTRLAGRGTRLAGRGTRLAGAGTRVRPTVRRAIGMRT